MNPKALNELQVISLKKAMDDNMPYYVKRSINLAAWLFSVLELDRIDTERKRACLNAIMVSGFERITDLTW